MYFAKRYGFPSPTYPHFRHYEKHWRWAILDSKAMWAKADFALISLRSSIRLLACGRVKVIHICQEQETSKLVCSAAWLFLSCFFSQVSSVVENNIGVYEKQPARKQIGSLRVNIGRVCTQLPTAFLGHHADGFLASEPGHNTDSGTPCALDSTQCI
ncbi:hypothetical protein BC629DRAFT_1726565 [Irpex lacteus]|nr:hypothetical protein BC629DRAFT_1726565 [Irpex lacteus]